MNLDLTKKINDSITKEYSSNTLKVEEDYKEISSGIQQILESQEIIENDIRRGFVGLATQNHKLIKFNENLNYQLEKVENELNMLKQEREKKAYRKESIINRKRLPKRETVTREIYKLLIQSAGSPNYTSIRLRIAICLLTVTGIRISELFSFKHY